MLDFLYVSLTHYPPNQNLPNRQIRVFFYFALLLYHTKSRYHYDKDLRKLTLATDTPNKRLDGIVAEPLLVYDAKEKSR